MGYIGTPIDTRNQFQSLQGKRFNGDGSTTDFTLDVAPGSTLDIEVFVGNVRQDPNSAYTLSGTTLTFTGAPPSGTNNIYVVHQAKSVGTIDVPADAVKADNLNSAVLTGQTDIGGAIADADLFLVDDGAGGTLRKTAASRLKTYIGSVGGDTGLDVNDSVKVRLGTGNDTELFFDGTNSVIDHTPGSGSLKIQGDQIILSDSASSPANHIQIDSGSGTVFNQDGASNIDFRVESNNVTHQINLNSDTDVILFGSDTDSEGSAYDQVLINTHKMQVSKASGTPFEINRNTNDGNLVDLRQGGTAEGTISVSGSTVSYNTFMGAHWSQLADNSKPTILRGTVVESIAEMCTWYTVKFDVNQHDSDESERYHYEEYELPSGKSVGDTVTITHGDKSFSGVIEKETNITLPKFKISDTEDSKAIYGVFHRWDDDDDGKNWQNDASIASLGTYMIRIHKDETVAIGDYIQSKGDGTGKKQADDILRASTIGKVTSTEKVITHNDGSYCVPCTLHCG